MNLKNISKAITINNSGFLIGERAAGKGVLLPY